mgnify:CR=1 FL=1
MSEFDDRSGAPPLPRQETPGVAAEPLQDAFLQHSFKPEVLHDVLRVLKGQVHAALQVRNHQRRVLQLSGQRKRETQPARLLLNAWLLMLRGVPSG